MRTVHVVVPEGIDDPSRPSGGNVYDRHLCARLPAVGWTVHRHDVPGRWPRPAPAEVDGLAAVLRSVPGSSTVLVDGLVASAAPDVVGRHAARLRLVVLVHLPLGVASLASRPGEGTMLSRVSAVVATSAWTRSWLVEHYGLSADRVGIAVPGTQPAALASGSRTGGALLCVGAVTAAKGHDLLLDALTEVAALPWSCRCVGSLDVDRAFARRLCGRTEERGIADRVSFAGPLHDAALDAAYRSADVLVLPSRAETYGMVLTEALARGVPVIATRTGGVPEAFGATAGGAGPGVLVPPDDAPALAAVLRRWLQDGGLRDRARRAARERRHTLPTWERTTADVAAVLARSPRT